MGEWSVTMKNLSKSMHASIVYGANIISNSQQMPKHIRVINQKTKNNFDAYIFIFIIFHCFNSNIYRRDRANINYQLTIIIMTKLNFFFTYRHTDIQCSSCVILLYLQYFYASF